MYHEYRNNANEGFAIGIIIFIIGQIIIAFFRYLLVRERQISSQARNERELTAFRLVFGEWNFNLKGTAH